MLICFKRVLWPRSLHGPELKAKSCSTRRMILILLGFGLLNPYAYFGTIVLLGSISTQYHGAAHYYFGIGAILASWVWFFGIAYGAKLIAPLFKSVAAWRVLDFVTGLIMLAVFFKLVVN
jgi:L-lysine exporter family protein LysE/ArgO